MIGDAFSLERHDLALKIIARVAKLPNDANSLPDKIMSFIHYKVKEIEDEHIQSCIQQFSANLYSSYWGQLPAYLKFSAISLLIQAERREEVQMAVNDILLQPEEDVLQTIRRVRLYYNVFVVNYSQ